jgi:hypothetical protein
MKLLFTALILTSFMGLGVTAQEEMGGGPGDSMGAEHREPAKSKKKGKKSHASKKSKKGKKHKTT